MFNRRPQAKGRRTAQTYHVVKKGNVGIDTRNTIHNDIVHYIQITFMTIFMMVICIYGTFICTYVYLYVPMTVVTCRCGKQHRL